MTFDVKVVKPEVRICACGWIGDNKEEGSRVGRKGKRNQREQEDS